MNSAGWKQLALLLVAALAVRLAAGLYWQSRLDSRFGFGDSESYWSLGRVIANGRPYEYGPEDAQVFRSPGYPLLLAPIFRLAGDQPSVMWARAQSAVFGTLVVAGVWWLARQLFDARTGLVAAVVAAFYPGAIATSALVLSEAPFCLLMLVQFCLWTAAWKAELPGRAGLLAVGVGLAAGAATLVRPSWLLFTPLAVLVAHICARGRPLWIGVGVLAGLAVAMMPWWIHNARLTGRFVPTTLQVGASLYDGLNPRATGASNMAFVPQFVRQQRRALPPDARQGIDFEVLLDRRFRAEALAWARANPGRVVRLAGTKLLRMWNIWPNEPSLSSWPIRLAVVCTYVPVLVLGLIGAARTIRRGWPYILCWLPVVYFTALHMVFVSSIRYRQPAMLGLMVLAAGAVTGIADCKLKIGKLQIAWCTRHFSTWG